MVRISTHRASTHPGEMLLQEFLISMGIDQDELAEAIRMSRQEIAELVSAERGISPAAALRLGRFLGVSPGFWLNLQTRWELHRAQSEEADVLSSIRPHESALRQA